MCTLIRCLFVKNSNFVYKNTGRTSINNTISINFYDLKLSFEELKNFTAKYTLLIRIDENINAILDASCSLIAHHVFDEKISPHN